MSYFAGIPAEPLSRQEVKNKFFAKKNAIASGGHARAEAKSCFSDWVLDSGS